MKQRAIQFATKAHGDQVRKYCGSPYITHPIAVAGIVESVEHTEEMLAAAVLHDVVEDTAVTLEQIATEFGETVAELVNYLTDVSKPEDGNRAIRKQMDAEHNAKGPAEAQTIKVADMIHNSSDIAVQDPKFWQLYKLEKLNTLNLLDKADPTLKARAFAQITGEL